MVGVSFPKCVVCKEEVDFQRHALCCDNCSRWQHRLCDSGISLKEYRSLQQEKIEIVWHCASCPTASKRQTPQILPKDIDVLLKSKNKDPLIDLPTGWKKKIERKSEGPKGKKIIYYISPHGRKFRSKKQAHEHSELHYQEVSPVNSGEDKKVFVTLDSLKLLAGTPTPITSKKYNACPEENKTNSKITAEGIDKNLQPLVQLLKLNDSDKIKQIQPYVNIRRLSPFTILRETKQTNPYVQVDEISDDRIELAVKDIVKQKNKPNTNNTNCIIKEENNIKNSKSKKKQQKLNNCKDLRNKNNGLEDLKINKNKSIKNKKNGIMDLKMNRNKSPMKVKAQLKKHSMNISLKIDRDSLQIDQNHKVCLQEEPNYEENSTEKKWNLKLGTVKVKNKGKNIKNIKNEFKNNDSEYEMSVEKKINQSCGLMSSAEDAKLRQSQVRPLVWLHISPKDIEFGLIS